VAIEPDRVRVAPNFDLIGIPLSGDQCGTAMVVLLSGILADGNSIDCARAMLVESVRISSREFVNLDLEASIHRNECLVVVGIRDTGEIAVWHREPGIAESDKHSGIVVNAPQLEFEFQDEVTEIPGRRVKQAKVPTSATISPLISEKFPCPATCHALKVPAGPVNS